MDASVALITGLLGMGSQAIANNKTQQDLSNDQRTTSIDELFNESFLSSLSDTERQALESTIAQGTTTTQRGTAESQQAIRDLLTGSTSPDAEAAIQARMSQVLESGAPAIANASNTAGSFDSTVSAQLQNDLATQAAQAGATMQLDQENQTIQNILAAITAAQAGTEQGTQTEQSDTGVTESTQQTTEQTSEETSTQTGDSLTDVGGNNALINLENTPLDQLLAANSPAEVVGPLETNPVASPLDAVLGQDFTGAESILGSNPRQVNTVDEMAQYVTEAEATGDTERAAAMTTTLAKEQLAQAQGSMGSIQGRSVVYTPEEQAKIDELQAVVEEVTPLNPMASRLAKHSN